MGWEEEKGVSRRERVRGSRGGVRGIRERKREWEG